MRASGLLVDHQIATGRTRAVGRSDRHVVKQVIDLRGIGDGDLDPGLSIFQTHPGHSRALVRVRTDGQKESGLLRIRRLEINENWAVYSVLESLSPARDATGLEYVW
jgi:hypothetical protein